MLYPTYHPEVNLDNWTFSEPERAQGADGHAVYCVTGTPRGEGENTMSLMYLPISPVIGVGVTERDALIDAVRQATVEQVRWNDAVFEMSKNLISGRLW